MTRFLLALSAAGLLAGSVPTIAIAAPCKDAKGKFVKCPPKPAKVPAKPKQCRDKNGKFIKCK